MKQIVQQTVNVSDVDNLKFLNQLRVDHEPVARLGRYFVQVAQCAGDLGLELSIEPIAELVNINRGNQVGWRRLLPLFNPDYNELNEDNAFCLVAKDQSGKAIACGACRLFDWTATDYARELQSLRLYYSDPAKFAGQDEQHIVRSTAAHSVTGRVVFAGAAWCHPEARGRSLSSIIPRTSKALALAKWDFDYMVGLMLDDVLQRGFAERFGYTKPERGGLIARAGGQEKVYAVLSMPRPEAVQHVEEFLLRRPPQVDRVVNRRLAQ